MEYTSENSSDEKNTRAEQRLISQFAHEIVAERRRARRWGIFFKLFFAGYLLLLLYLAFRSDIDASLPKIEKEHTALIEINGILATESHTSAYTNADSIVRSLNAAYDNDNVAGIILRINSPGGSPVQSAYVHDEILRLREQHPDIPVHTVVVDICASGGYYIASATENIYANESSLVGSIGVIWSGFGFVDTLEKLGIERRLLTAGENKAMMDPFSPEKSSDINHMQTLLDEVQKQFRQVVETGRGDRLQDNEEIFSGLIWTGVQAMELGLIDGLGSTGAIARDIIGAEDIHNYTQSDNFLDELGRQLGIWFHGLFSAYLPTGLQLR